MARKKRELNPRASRCVAQVIDIFGFLVTEYGFVVGEPTPYGREWGLAFTRPPVKVMVTWEGVCLPLFFIAYQRGQEWIYLTLSALSRCPLTSRYPAIPKPAPEMNEQEFEEASAQLLRIDAELLKEYGQAFLAGDPSQLLDVRPGQFDTVDGAT